MMSLCSSIAFSIVAALPGMTADDRNAASWYQRAAEHIQQISDEDWRTIEQYIAQPHRASDEALNGIISNAQEAIELLQQGASQSQVFFFDADPWRGMDSRNPQHQFYMPKLALLMQANALNHFQAGRSEQGAAALQQSFEIVGHASSDGTLQAASKSLGLLRSANGLTSWAVDTGAVGQADASAVLKAVRAFQEGDPLHYVDALVSENERMQLWLLQMHQDGQYEQMEKYIDAVQPGLAPDFSDITEEEFLDGVTFSLTAVDAIADIYLNEDDPEKAAAAIGEITSMIQESEYAFLMPWSDQLAIPLRTMPLALAEIASAENTLKPIAAGAVADEDSRNAAILYLMAIERYRTREAEHAEIEEALRLQVSDKVAKRAAAFVAEQGEIVQLLRDATGLERCDFAAALNQPANVHSIAIAPEYVDSFLNLIRLVTIDIRAKTTRGNSQSPLTEDHIERLIIALRMIYDLGQDSPLVSSYAASLGLAEMRDAIAGTLEPQILQKTQAAGLRMVLEEFPPADPLGFLASSRASLDSITSVLSRGNAGNQDAGVTDVRNTIKDWRANQLLLLLLAIDTYRTDATESSHLRALWTILPPEKRAVISAVRADLGTEVNRDRFRSLQLDQVLAAFKERMPIIDFDLSVTDARVDLFLLKACLSGLIGAEDGDK